MTKILKTVTTTTTTTSYDYAPAKAGETKSNRLMKVGYICRDKASARGRSYDVPFIRMAGNWLADAGFGIGDQIQVEVKENQLVVTRLEEKSVTEEASTVS